MKWLGALFLLVSVVAGTASTATPGKAYFNRDSVHLVCGLAPDAKLVFRDPSGAMINEDAFFAAANDGRSISCKADTGSGVAVLTLDKPQAEQREAVHSLTPGDHLPAFSLMSSNGRKLSADRFDHDLNVVSFFYYDCSGCVAEIPALNAFRAAHPDIGTLAITYDSVAELASFQKRFGLTWEIVPDAVTFYEKANIEAFPTLGIVDRHGRVLDLKGSWQIHPKGRGVNADDIAQWVASVQKKTAPLP